MAENELSAVTEKLQSLEKEVVRLSEAQTLLARRLRELEFKLAKLERR